MGKNTHYALSVLAIVDRPDDAAARVDVATCKFIAPVLPCRG
jgi:hypothetical protein